MHITSRGPWHARLLLWQPSAETWATTVVCSLAFELMPGESPIVAMPLEPPARDDDRWFVEPWGPPVPVKRRPEVMVLGHAYAPADRRTTQLLARVTVGDFEKVIQVSGNSHFAQDGSLVGPSPFTRMPLRWELAAGGPYTSNPVGVPTGRDALADSRGRVPFRIFSRRVCRCSRGIKSSRPLGWRPYDPVAVAPPAVASLRGNVGRPTMGEPSAAQRLRYFVLQRCAA